MITLQFSNRKSLISKAVQFRTWSWASHVDFVLPDGQLLGASWEDGVALRDFNPDDYDRVERYTVDMADEEVLVHAMSRLGDGYDFAGVLGFLIRKDVQDANDWFCSEFVAWAFQMAGTPILNPWADNSKLSPSQLLLSPHLKPVVL